MSERTTTHIPTLLGMKFGISTSEAGVKVNGERFSDLDYHEPVTELQLGTRRRWAAEGTYNHEREYEFADALGGSVRYLLPVEWLRERLRDDSCRFLFVNDPERGGEVAINLDKLWVRPLPSIEEAFPHVHHESEYEDG